MAIDIPGLAGPGFDPNNVLGGTSVGYEGSGMGPNGGIDINAMLQDKFPVYGTGAQWDQIVGYKSPTSIAEYWQFQNEMDRMQKAVRASQQPNAFHEAATGLGKAFHDPIFAGIAGIALAGGLGLIGAGGGGSASALGEAAGEMGAPGVGVGGAVSGASTAGAAGVGASTLPEVLVTAGRLAPGATTTAAGAGGGTSLSSLFQNVSKWAKPVSQLVSVLGSSKAASGGGSAGPSSTGFDNIWRNPYATPSAAFGDVLSSIPQSFFQRPEAIQALKDALKQPTIPTVAGIPTPFDIGLPPSTIPGPEASGTTKMGSVGGLGNGGGKMGIQNGPWVRAI